jgi:N-acetylglucosamine-6-sulfatase
MADRRRGWHTRRQQRAAGVLLATAAVATAAVSVDGAAADSHGDARYAVQLGPPASGQRQAPRRPNIVFVLADDMSLDQLPYLDKVNALIKDRGVTFDRAYSPYSLCCPARATILSGQYPHNHGVMSNDPPLGGITAFHDKETLPVWLHRAGYNTVLIGKYLNHYNLVAKYRPPGWTSWNATINELQYRVWDQNRNGRRVHFHRYATHVIAAETRSAISNFAQRKAPFFLYVSFIAPHAGDPADPDDPPGWSTPNVSDGYRDALATTIPPEPASFNEDDMSDKPAYLRSRPKVSRDAAVEVWQQRTEAMLSVDDAVGSIVTRLRDVGELSSTIVVFASDNGYLVGQHRWRSKAVPYEEATHIPLLIRGPGFPAGHVTRQLVSLVDIAPTFLRAARARATRPMDGAPLQQLAADPQFLARRGVVLEAGTAELVPDTAPVDRRHRYYWGIRAPSDKVLVRYATGEREYYDLIADPAELTNTADDPASAAAVSRLSRWLRAIKNCAGLDCRQPSPAP